MSAVDTALGELRDAQAQLEEELWRVRSAIDALVAVRPVLELPEDEPARPTVHPLVVPSRLPEGVPVEIPAAAAPPEPAAEQGGGTEPDAVPPPAPSSRRSGRDLEQVAAVAIAAHEEGRSARASVAEHFATSQANAADLIRRARAAGHPVPKGRPGRKPTPARTAGPAPERPPRVLVEEAVRRQLPAEKVLRCGCGHEALSINDLTRHTLSEHRRGPSPRERTPVAATETAA